MAQRYVSGLSLTEPRLGLGSGAGVTTGANNLLLGAGAGGAVTTGSHNIVLGGYAGAERPAMLGEIVLSNGLGDVACSWTADGTPQQRLQPADTVTAPTAPGYARMAYDPATGAIVYRVAPADGGPAVTSTSATKASIDALGVNAASVGGVAAADIATRQSVQLAPPTVGTSLVADAAALRLRGLAVAPGGLLRLDTSNPDVLTLDAAGLADAPNAPAGAVSLVGATSGAAGDGTLRTKVLVAGAGLRATTTGGAVTIESVAPGGDAVTLADAGAAAAGAASLVADGAGPTLAVRALVPGDGIALSADAVAQTVAVRATTTLADEPGAPVGAQSLVGPSTAAGATLRARSLVAGAGIALTAGNGGSTVTIENTQTSAGVTLASAGGTESIVTDGVGPSLAVRGLTAGYGVGLVADATSVRVRANGVVVVPVRPSDVVATSGQAVVVPLGTPLPLTRWPIDANLKPLALPALRYRSSAAASHVGTAVFAVHGLPPNLPDLGWRVLLSLQAPAGTAAFAWTLTLTVPVLGTVWDYQEYVATLAVPAFVAGDAGDAAPTRTLEVTGWAPQVVRSGSTVACVDGATRPSVSGLAASPLVVALKMAGSAPLPADVDVMGLNLVLVPATST